MQLLGGVEHAEGDAVCQQEHHFRRKLDVTQGLLFCLLQASLPKRLENWKTFQGGAFPLALCWVGIEALRWGVFFRARGW